MIDEVYKINVNADTKNLKVIADFIEKKLEERRLKSEIIDEVVVAVDEAATNVIKHSYKEKADEYMKILLKVIPGKIVVSIFDKGIIFEPNKIPVPELSKSLNARSIGGLGIFLMKRFMDEVTFYFKGTDGRDENEVRMVKYINKK